MHIEKNTFRDSSSERVHSISQEADELVWFITKAGVEFSNMLQQ